MTVQTASARPTIWQRSSLRRFCLWLFTWRIMRRLLIVLLWTITLLALLYGIENWRGRRAWLQYRQQLESQGEQLELSAFIPKPVPDEQNFASTPVVQSWFVKGGSGPWTGSDDYARLSGKVGPASKNGPQGERRFLDLVGWEMALAAARTGPLAPGQRFESGQMDSAARAKAVPAVLNGLSSIEPTLAELSEASRRSFCRYPVVYNLENPWAILLPHLGAIRAACNRLELRACAHLAAGQADQALADVKLMFYLEDSMADEPFVVGFLVRVACHSFVTQPIWEGLADHRWSEPQLQELQRRLQQLDFLADFKRPLDAERAASILTAELIRKNGLGMLVVLTDSGPISDKSLANLVGQFVPSGWYYREQLTYCQLRDQGLKGGFDLSAHRVFPRQLEANSRALEATMTSGGRHRGCQDVLHHRVLASLLLPALGKIPAKAATAQVAADQAALACALERCRLATGQFPEKLEALQPRFINTLPIDPCSGQIYRYQRNPDGQFVLYSVGWNETDDGGFPGQTLFDEKQGDWVWEYPKR